MLLKDRLKNTTTIEIYELVLSREISRFPEFFWKGEDGRERGVECVKYLLYQKLRWTDEDIRTKFEKKILIKNKLAGMLQSCFNNSPLKCIMTLMGSKYQPWEYNVAPRHYWSIETARYATTFMINALEWTDNDIKKYLSQKTFKDYGLESMLNSFYNGSPYEAINDVMPGKIKEWELPNTPLNFWTEENCIEAIEWIKSKEEIAYLKNVNCDKIRTIFIKNGLGYMLQKKFNNSVKKALQHTDRTIHRPANKYLEIDLQNPPGFSSEEYQRKCCV